MATIKIKEIFHQGPIPPSLIADVVAKHQGRTAIGGHDIFLGQIRADEVDGKKVKAIEYTAYEDMAREQMAQIREDIFAKYHLECVHIFHSLGTIKSGEICLFVMTSAGHREEAIDGCKELVNRLKKELPIWGKEIFEDEDYQWKVNR